MRYWKGVLIAIVFDAALIAGPRFLATEPPEPARSQAILWPPPAAAPVSAPAPQLPTLGELGGLSRQIDSLMLRLQEHPADVAALQQLARLYSGHEWWEDAIGPLARALLLAPQDGDVAKQLGVALERSGKGRARATDAEILQWALDFVDVVEMWGHGC
jgi:cytochrome c-type biogenesis protein CcmH/NrfG